MTKNKSFLITFIFVFVTLLSMYAKPGLAQFNLPFAGGVTTDTNAGFTVDQWGKYAALEGRNWGPQEKTVVWGAGKFEGPRLRRYIGVLGRSKKGYGGWFESENDAYDMVLGGKNGRLNSDPNSKNSNIVISSNNNVYIRLDNDGGGDGRFMIYDSGGKAVFSVNEKGKISTAVLKITGGSDLAESFKVVDLKSNMLPSPGMLVSIDPENPGDLKISHKAYDRKVAGIISGAGGVNSGVLMGNVKSTVDDTHPVAISGRVYCLADASQSPIIPGDLLTTSDTSGHAMKVKNFTKAQGAIIGKAMTKLDKGRGLILVLVTLQ